MLKGVFTQRQTGRCIVIWTGNLPSCYSNAKWENSSNEHWLTSSQWQTAEVATICERTADGGRTIGVAKQLQPRHAPRQRGVDKKDSEAAKTRSHHTPSRPPKEAINQTIGPVPVLSRPFFLPLDLLPPSCLKNHPVQQWRRTGVDLSPFSLPARSHSRLSLHWRLVKRYASFIDASKFIPVFAPSSTAA